MNEPYPSWVCWNCAQRAKGKPSDVIQTWHYGTCDVCGKKTHVTEPRDFGDPKFKGHENPD